ncbi:MAG: hypothetical protein ED559_02940 [Phycisphaera sp.]|nr:MAG: hypothetical protein ED559_02940 [Phycisphaera sp.]
MTLICAGTAQSPEPRLETAAADGRVTAIAATPVRVDAKGSILEFGDTVQLGRGVSRGSGACDQNGYITPTDFTAWIAAFNQGQSGPICSP